MVLIISIIAASIVLCVISGFWVYVKNQTDPIPTRLHKITPNFQHIRVSEREKTSFKKALMFLFGRMFPIKKSGWEKNRIHNELLKAGFRSQEALSVFTGLRIFSLLVLPSLCGSIALTLNVQPKTLIFVFVMACMGGIVLPGYMLDKLVSKRGYKIKKELPSVLDLLVIAVESGLGLDAAIRRVTRELYHSGPTLAEELSLYSLEVRIGSAREIALKNLSKRCGIDEVGSLVAMLIQADKFGVSVAQSLRVHAQDLRTKRRQELEEAAAKIPLKLLFPVLFLIFPAIMAVMLGPAIISIKDIFF